MFAGRARLRDVSAGKSADLCGPRSRLDEGKEQACPSCAPRPCFWKNAEGTLGKQVGSGVEGGSLCTVRLSCCLTVSQVPVFFFFN